MNKTLAHKQASIIYSLERKIKTNKRKNMLEKVWKFELISWTCIEKDGNLLNA